MAASGILTGLSALGVLAYLGLAGASIGEQANGYISYSARFDFSAASANFLSTCLILANEIGLGSAQHKLIQFVNSKIPDDGNENTGILETCKRMLSRGCSSISNYWFF